MSDVREFREQVPHDGNRWQQWRFDEKTSGLEYEDEEGDCILRLDLTTIDSSARLIDWIFWMSGHKWYNRHDLAALSRPSTTFSIPGRISVRMDRTRRWMRRNIFTSCQGWASWSTSR